MTCCIRVAWATCATPSATRRSSATTRAGQSVVDESVKENMKEVLARIQDGSFAREWIAENDEGRPTFYRMRDENAAHPIEEVGKELRAMMPFLQDVD